MLKHIKAVGVQEFEPRAMHWVLIHDHSGMCVKTGMNREGSEFMTCYGDGEG